MEQARVQGGGGPKGPGPPPLEIEKQKKKKKKKKKKKRLSDFGPPLLRIPGHAPVESVVFVCYLVNNMQNNQTYILSSDSSIV